MVAVVPTVYRSVVPGSSISRMALQEKADRLLRARGFLRGDDRLAAPERQRRDESREQHEVAHRHDDQRVGRQRPRDRLRFEGRGVRSLMPAGAATSNEAAVDEVAPARTRSGPRGRSIARSNRP